MLEATPTTMSRPTFLPEELQDRLIYWRDTLKTAYFELGDIAYEVIEAFADKGYPVTHQEIFEEIGRFVGKSGRTIRRYYEVALFYPEAVRDEYDMLPFSHFTAARYMGEVAGISWQEILDFAKEHPNYSEAGLRHYFLYGQEREDEYVADSVAAENDEDAKSYGDEIKPPPRHRLLAGVSDIRNGLGVIRDYSIHDDRVEKVLQQIEENIRNLVDILAELDIM